MGCGCLLMRWQNLVEQLEESLWAYICLPRCCHFWGAIYIALHYTITHNMMF